eukprot:TRINITY_DN3030_c0_g3_i1.p1 TRINITY_DN3030_c0_g3~~TRINITY_DN3030_c0_g3_i1.p1  ORF type:complete len:1000 (+),score=282.19 TRINITY_DN3030_c0_g3_i1:49-3000(+)
MADGLRAARAAAEAELEAAKRQLNEANFKIGERVECRDDDGPWTLGTVMSRRPVLVRADGWIQAYEWGEIRRPDTTPQTKPLPAPALTPPAERSFRLQRQKAAAPMALPASPRRRGSLAAQFVADLAAAASHTESSFGPLPSQLMSVGNPTKILRLRLSRKAALRAAVTATREVRGAAAEEDWDEIWAASESCPLQEGSTVAQEECRHPMVGHRQDWTQILEVVVVRGDSTLDVRQRILTALELPTCAEVIPVLSSDAVAEIRDLSYNAVRPGEYTLTLEVGDPRPARQSLLLAPPQPPRRPASAAKSPRAPTTFNLERAGDESSLAHAADRVERWLSELPGTDEVMRLPPGAEPLEQWDTREALVLRIDSLEVAAEELAVQRGADAIAQLRRLRRHIARDYLESLTREEDVLVPPRTQRLPVHPGDTHDDIIDTLRVVYAAGGDAFPPHGCIHVLNARMEEVQLSTLIGGERLFCFPEPPPAGHVQALEVLQELQHHRHARQGRLTVAEGLPMRGREKECPPTVICFYPRLQEMEGAPSSNHTEVGQPLTQPFAAAADTEGTYGVPESLSAQVKRKKADSDATSAQSVPAAQDTDGACDAARAVIIRDSRHPTQFSQGDILPGFASRMQTHESATQLAASVSLCACLVHGVAAEHFLLAAEQGRLISAYTRLGPRPPPKLGYSRKSDVRGGGATAVYTRAVGLGHEDWGACGHGVGSGEAKVQVVMCADILRDPEHVWRASTTDNMGKLPGVSVAEVGGKEADRRDLFHLWSAQTEDVRNRLFYETVKGRRCSENNEQMHWEQIPLGAVLCAVVGTAKALEGFFERVRYASERSAAASVDSSCAEDDGAPDVYTKVAATVTSSESVDELASPKAPDRVQTPGRKKRPRSGRLWFSPGSPSGSRGSVMLRRVTLCGRLVPIVKCKADAKLLSVLKSVGLIGKDGRVVRAPPAGPVPKEERHDTATVPIQPAAAAGPAPEAAAG